MRQNVLIKISGDLVKDERTLNFIAERARGNFVVVISGGGTEISEELKAAGIKFEFGPAGRITDYAGRQIARDILERHQAQLQDEFITRGINVVVVIPVIEIGTVLCHINGDDFLKLGYNSFDALYCFTRLEKIQDKENVFREYPKIRVIGI